MLYNFVTLKDPHLSFGFQNKIRTNYEGDVLKKFEYLKNYCVLNNIQDCVFTGDVFDSSHEDKWSFKKFRKNKRVLEDLKTSLSLFSNVGNHDMFHGYEGSDETVFGEMVHDGVLQNITTDPIIKDNMILLGIDYHHNYNDVLAKLKEANELPYKTICVVLHSNITPSEVENISNDSYVSLSTTFPNIDMFICGHYHVGYKTTKIDRDLKPAYFVNNWNFTRVVRDYETELDEHIPEFEHVTIDTISGQIMCKTIQIPFTPYKDAFIPKLVQLLVKTKKEIFDFFNSINIEDIKNSSENDDEALIKKIQAKNNYSDESIIKAIEYLNSQK
ncbi:MAG: hypothetical protein WC136_09315 [Sphaerochaeta sp.]